jgi:4-hydroxy-3-methylbut-2-enyl diphosphate reductase
MKILLANPRGFCAGVDRAIEIVELALKKYGAPVYVRHEIVHNKFVVDDLRAKGAVFVDEISEIPDGAITVFSAHGVSEKVENSAKLRDLPVIDATCPLVTKVHNEAQRYENEAREIVLIGHKGHPEVEGTSGRVQKVQLVENVADVAGLVVENADNLAYVTQTTLSLDDTKVIIEALKKRFPNIDGPDTRDICYATQNRQNAVRELAKKADLLLVIGASNSSNSNRLRDLGEEIGIKSYLIDNAEGIDAGWLVGAKIIGVTAGASAPEVLVQRVIDRLRELGANELEEFAGKKENVKFKLTPLVI